MTAEQQQDIASSTAGNLSKIMGEQTEAGRAMAVVQTTIDTLHFSYKQLISFFGRYSCM
jgi:hypothetical protein